MSIATAPLPKLACGYLIAGMQTISETRRQRLAILVRRYGEKLADLNEAIGLDRTDSTLSQIRTQAKHSKTGKPRVMGDDLARKIENELQLEAGWMDTPPNWDELLSQEDPRIKAYQLLEQMSPEQAAVATRLLTAIAEPEKKQGNGG